MTIDVRAIDVAVMRGVPDSIARCELTHLEREPIDLNRALAQHAAYAALLVELGLEVIEIPADPAFPDCCFVEDVAVVLDGLAVLTRPGAPSRRGEAPLSRRRSPASGPSRGSSLPPPSTGGTSWRWAGRSTWVARPAPTPRASRGFGPWRSPWAIAW